ncbi:hypothetical protein HYPSUDRAFT_43476 [Hypholoma sublateritium FD-334 SS-4]|uniref:Uncharacterized protein n=1 Tax=Hypholoma sublateritium (strain FD-334 SS-4) TaxID=945553 RepID=A0A0D2NMU7_HYPSF|nr:hypothetical protein HYPSUDRAFT_43476 [Hypholoma sublateritium FD-334 SS-4]
MALNAYNIQNRVTLRKSIPGFYYYGPIANRTSYSADMVVMGPPTVFEIIKVAESDHNRTSLSPVERAQDDYIYRLIVRCNRSKCRVTYDKVQSMPTSPSLIPHTSIREVQRTTESRTFFYPLDIVRVTTPFEYPSTSSGVYRAIILEKGTLLCISSISKSQKGGKNTKTDPNKGFYQFYVVEATEHYDIYWKAASNVTHSDIVDLVSLN